MELISIITFPKTDVDILERSIIILYALTESAPSTKYKANETLNIHPHECHKGPPFLLQHKVKKNQVLLLGIYEQLIQFKLFSHEIKGQIAKMIMA